MILCTYCGRQNRGEDLFCTACGNRLAQQPIPIGRLTLLGAEKKEYLIAGADRFVGRAADNDIVLDDELVSARHARLYFAAETFWVEDLNSTNGILINGQRIQSKSALSDEDLIAMGQSFFQFRV